jgi:tetratricopeptide (TPR) repeat protein
MKPRLRLKCRTLVLAFALLALGLRAGSPPTTEEAQKWEQLITDTTKALKANNVPEAIRLCDEAMDRAGKFGPTDTRLSRSQVLRAEVYLWEKKKGLAEQTFKQAIASCEKAAGSNNVVLVHPLSSLANFYYFVAVRYDLVVPLFQRILTLEENAPHPNQRDLIMWSRNLGMIYQQTGQYALGEPLFKKAVALAEKADAEWLPHELLTAADFYRAWGKYEQAEALASRALSIREKAMPPDAGVDAKLDVAVSLKSLGAIYLSWNKPDQAEAAFRRSLAIIQTFMSPDQSDLAPHLEGLAAALRAQGKYGQAEPLYQRALAITEKNVGANRLETAVMLEKYAGLLIDMKKTGEANGLLARAETIRKQHAAMSN